MSPLKNIIKDVEKQITTYSYNFTQEENILISGTIVINKKDNKISFTLSRTENGIIKSEGASNHKWFVDELKKMQYKQFQEERLTSVFKK